MAILGTVMRSFVIAAAALLVAAPAHATLQLSFKPTRNMDCTTPGVCMATDANAVMNIDELTAMLEGSDMRIVTDGLFFQDVEVQKPVAWSSSHGLTIESNDAVFLHAPISVLGAASFLDLQVPGGPIYASHGAIKFADTNSRLTIDGDDYRLVGSIAELAGTVARHPKGLIALAHDYNAHADGQVRNTPVQTEFGGTFDGLGNVISNFSIWDTVDGNIALFKALKGKGRIVRVGMTKVNVLAENTFNNVAGALVAYNAGTIIDCYVDQGTIRTDFLGTLGGLVGQNYGDVFESWANVSVEGAQGGATGGLIGNAHGHVQNVYALGRVIAGDNTDVGGLIGYNFGHVSKAYATGHVSGGQNARVGGLMGTTQLAVRTSYWNTETSGTQFGVGGHNVDGVTGMTTAQLQASLPGGFQPFVWGLAAKINGGLPYLLHNPSN